MSMAMKPQENLLAPPTGTPGKESTATLLRHPDFTLEHIVSRGAASPEGFWYDQDRDEWALLLQGTAEIRYESGETIALTAGAPLLIPAHCRHRVEKTSADAIWLALFYSAARHVL
jgi:cupin 2 domain-containing protein